MNTSKSEGLEFIRSRRSLDLTYLDRGMDIYKQIDAMSSLSFQDAKSIEASLEIHPRWNKIKKLTALTINTPGLRIAQYKIPTHQDPYMGVLNVIKPFPKTLKVRFQRPRSLKVWILWHLFAFFRRHIDVMDK